MGSPLIFERSVEGRRCVVLGKLDVEPTVLEDCYVSDHRVDLPEIAEVDLVRHYTNLSREAKGVDNVFYPLGSCTMKYNPKFNEAMASLRRFTRLHPLQPVSSLQGILAGLYRLQESLGEITGMDQFTLQPAAGAQGEFLALSMIAKYHQSRGDHQRTIVIVPDSAHGTNPASAAMAGYQVQSVPSNAQGGVDLEALTLLLNHQVAALMLTNPNTLGLFDPNIVEIVDAVHQAGGLVYYDGANMNAIMGLSRPGDVGFDVVHLNLHKTFSTPHGGGGPGAGPVGVKAHLVPFLPKGTIIKTGSGYDFLEGAPLSVGRIRSFYGNTLVLIRALTYILTLGADGLKETSEAALINANYLMEKLKTVYTVAYPGICMHEFVLTLKNERETYHVSAKDVSKALLDESIHSPTMYFPSIVEEALMIEPTETESQETLDHAVDVLLEIHQRMVSDPESLQAGPWKTLLRRVDEVQAARHPILRYVKK